MAVHFLPSDATQTEVLVAYSIGRQVGGAVVRNRWRRRLRAIAGEIAGELRPGAYLIGIGPGVHSLNYLELKERVSNTMRKASEERT